VRKRIYMAYVSTLIDSNVMLISYRAPADGPDDGAAVWQAFADALADSAAKAQVAPTPAMSFQDHLDMSVKSGAFRPAIDVFIAAARFGDQFTTLELISPRIVETAGREFVDNYLVNQVLPFFAAFQELGRSTTVQPTMDTHGSSGFVFHLSMKAKDGRERPFSIYVVEENGEKVIANVLVDYDFRTSGR
jgi:hypothetical protein